jgi:hypothetical protein
VALHGDVEDRRHTTVEKLLPSLHARTSTLALMNEPSCGCRRSLSLVCAALASALAVACSSGAEPVRPAPRRALIIVVDMLRREFVDLFDMKNIKGLMAQGVSYPNAYLGHMASETVISHNVMVSGLYPKHMGWSDEVYRDADDVLGDGPGKFQVSGSMNVEQFTKLVRRQGYLKLADYLHQKFPGTKMAVVAQKNYAAITAGVPSADIIVHLSGRSFDCSKPMANDWRGPAGVNVPSYLSEPRCGRFYLNSSKDLDYGTRTTVPAWMYPEDGDRFIPGRDPAHQGGDVWVADAAIEIMKNENWSGMLLSFGALDKVGHMWGGINDTREYPAGSDDEMVHQKYIARVADEQVGRVVAKLRELGQLEETLIVLTTDHGQNQALNFHGIDQPGRSDFNWYFGADSDETYLMPSPPIEGLNRATGDNVAFSYQDSAIRTWLKDSSLARKQEAAQAMRALPSVIATYYLQGDRYILDSSSTATPMTAAERSWWASHGQEIVDSMAAPWAPDVVGLLQDNTSYGVHGDHGGAQEAVQRIPMIFSGPGIAAGARPSDEFRTVDLLPTMLWLLDIQPRGVFDGKARVLPAAR